jgi:Tfp pilus assembly protein PilF
LDPEDSLKFKIKNITPANRYFGVVISLFEFLISFGGKMKFPAFGKRFIWVYVVILLFGIAFFWGCGAKNPALTSAKIYLGLTPPDYDHAMEQLQLALQRDPENGEAHYLLGKIYAEKKMYDLMLQELQKAETCKLKPEQLQELREIKVQKWTEVFNSAIQLGRDRKQIDQYKLDLLTDFSGYPQVKDSLKALSADLEGAEKLSWDIYQMFSQAKPALEDLERMLEEKAIGRYLLAIQIDSTRYEAYLNLAAEYVSQDELETALGYYQKAYQLKPEDSSVMNNYAITLLNAKKFEQALGLYETILGKDPTNLNALVNLAMIYVRQGEAEKALDTYSKIISLDPEYEDAYFNRGLLFLSQAHDQIPILKAYRDSVDENPKDRELFSRYQSAQQDYDRLFSKAKSDFQKTSEIDPGDRDAFFHLGLLYVSRAQITGAGESQKQDFVRAEESFKKCRELDPSDMESAKYLGFVLINQSKWKEASLQLEEVVGSLPTDREAWGYLAIAYARMGEKNKAEEAFKKSAR